MRYGITFILVSVGDPFSFATQISMIFVEQAACEAHRKAMQTKGGMGENFPQ